MKKKLSIFIFLFIVSTDLFALSKKEELLRLNLDALLYTKDLDNAFKLAKSVADERCDDEFWIEQAAKIAIWNGEADGAKIYFKKLYEINHKKEILQKLQTLANQTNDESLKISILEDKLAHKELKYASSLYEAYELEGRLYEGTIFFEKVYEKYKVKELLKYKLLLVKDYASFELFEREYLSYQKAYGVDEDLTFFYAKKLFAKREYQKVFLYLDKLRDKISIKRVDFWEFYIDLSYTLKKEKKLYLVLKKRFKQHKIKKDNFLKLLYLSKKIDPNFRNNVIKNYYYKYPSKTTFYLYTSLLKQEKQDKDISEILKDIPVDLLKTLKQDSSYWLLKASDYKYQQKEEKALEAYKIALKLSPKNIDIQKSIIWSLIDGDFHDELKIVLQDVTSSPTVDKNLSYALSSAYVTLGENKKAIEYFKSMKIGKEEWQKRIFYADILSKELDTKASSYQLRRAYIDAKKELNKNSIFKDSNQKLFDFIRLVVKYEPLNVKKYLKIAKKRFSKEKLAELYLSQAVHDDQYLRAKFIAKEYRLEHSWLKLYFANFNKDKKIINELLQNDIKLQKLSLANVAYSLGMKKETEKFVKKALANDKKDKGLSEFLKKVLIDKKPKVNVSIEHIKRAELSYFKESIKLNKQFSNRDAYIEFDQKNSLSTYMNHHNDSILKLGFSKTDTNWYYGIRASARKRFDMEYGYQIDTGYKDNDTNIKLSVSKNDEDDSSNFMLLYANKDVAKFRANYNISKRDILKIEFYKNRYFQKSTYLGDSFGGGINYSKFFRFGYPMIMIDSYFQFQDYTISDNRFTFKDYWQVGMSALLGDNNHQSFHKNRRFYTLVNLLYNSQTNLGYSVILGMSNKLFDTDRLDLEASYSSGLGKIDEDFIHLICRYSLW